jgi:hypothetical protein
MPFIAIGGAATSAQPSDRRGMPRQDDGRSRRRTRKLPPELAVWSAAVLGAEPVKGLTANAAEFPHLAAPAPLVLTVDEDGWYRLTITDRSTGTSGTGYVRRQWARERVLEQLGVSRSPVVIRRR